MQEKLYKVADMGFRVCCPSGWDLDAMLVPFHDFVWDGTGEMPMLFTLRVNGEGFPVPQTTLEPISTSDNDVGHVVLFSDATHYWAKMSYGHNERYVHRWRSDKAFTVLEAQLQEKDPFLNLALTSILRVAFSQAILCHQGVSIHASCVWKEEKAYLFLGKSGTGKSTHSRLWMEYLPDVQLLNDDNPALRIIGETVWAYGTPWSGKTSCYKNLRFPVAGIVHLQQGKQNYYEEKDGIDGFAEVLPSCSAIRADRKIQHYLYDNVLQLVSMVKVGKLQCLPNAEAAWLCHDNLTKVL